VLKTWSYVSGVTVANGSVDIIPALFTCWKKENLSEFLIVFVNKGTQCVVWKKVKHSNLYNKTFELLSKTQMLKSHDKTLTAYYMQPEFGNISTNEIKKTKLRYHYVVLPIRQCSQRCWPLCLQLTYASLLSWCHQWHLLS